VHAEFAQEVSAMSLCRARTDRESAGDLRVRFEMSDPAQDGFLTVGE
jgi:hypothetical protein